METNYLFAQSTASVSGEERVSYSCRGLSIEGKEEKKMQTKRSNKLNQTNKKVVPVFFAADDIYLPFLTVAISSLKKNRSQKFQYKIHVMHSGLNGEDAERLMSYAEEDFQIFFVDVAEKMKEIEKFLCLRDYYTSAIYYRLFIVNMFPEYDKAVYLDSDTVVLGDISEFYSVDLGDNLIGAITDQVVSAFECFRRYTKEALGIEPERYFNSGVILMNLKKLREENFYQAFYSKLSGYPFRVAPDQDCLNVICKDRVYYFPLEWNQMPISGTQKNPPKIMHYNLAEKPWHYDDIINGEIFWKYAKKTCFYDRILRAKENFTPSMAKRDQEGGKKLMELAMEEVERKDNYYRLYVEKQ